LATSTITTAWPLAGMGTTSVGVRAGCSIRRSGAPHASSSASASSSARTQPHTLWFTEAISKGALSNCLVIDFIGQSAPCFLAMCDAQGHHWLGEPPGAQLLQTFGGGDLITIVDIGVGVAGVTMPVDSVGVDTVISVASGADAGCAALPAPPEDPQASTIR